MTFSTTERWTIFFLALTVMQYIQILHEGVGHALTCKLVGGTVNALTATFVACDNVQKGTFAFVFTNVMGAGSNILAAAAHFAFYRRLRQRARDADASSSSHWLYVNMVGTSFNLCTGFGYLCASPLFGWGDFFNALEPLEGVSLIIAIFLTVVGVVVYLLIIMRVMPYLLEPWLGPEPDIRWRRGMWLTLPPFAANAVIAFLSGLWTVPHDARVGFGIAFITLVANTLGAFGFGYAGPMTYFMRETTDKEWLGGKPWQAPLGFVDAQHTAIVAIAVLSIVVRLIFPFGYGIAPLGSAVNPPPMSAV